MIYKTTLILGCVGWMATSAMGALIGLGEASNYAILGLSNGTVTINSATSIIGNVGYSSGVISTTNQKVSQFTGTAYVHGQVADFRYTPSTYKPSGGIVTNQTADALLDQANLDALAASRSYAKLAPNQTLGVINDINITINSTGPVNVISIASINMNSDIFTMNSRSGFEDVFIFNVLGDFAWSQSAVTGTALASNIIWNFPNSSSIDINKESTVFLGTILAPTGSVIYHNPASFDGAIIARDINLHSMFNLEGIPSNVPKPATLGLWAMGSVILTMWRRIS